MAARLSGMGSGEQDDGQFTVGLGLHLAVGGICLDQLRPPLGAFGGSQDPGVQGFGLVAVADGALWQPSKPDPNGSNPSAMAIVCRAPAQDRTV